MSTTREQQTIQAMVEIYCRAHHAPPGKVLCEDCRALFEYAQARLGKCPFGPEKPVCSKCPVHCYQPAMRDRIREVMRYAGPRMAWRHPALAWAHLRQKSRPAPDRPGRAEDKTRSAPAGIGPNAMALHGVEGNFSAGNSDVCVTEDLGRDS